jgi:glycosyltransferase involved in cell wall biosynthesis
MPNSPSNSPLVSVIVPTYNSEKLLQDFLNSILKQKYSNIEVVINDDVRSNDTTESLLHSYILKGLKIIYIKENISMAQGRKKAVEYASGSVLIHLDSDMQITEDLISECVNLINNGCDAVIIPEESFGIGFWAKCKWLEKKCYEGIENIESLRCVKSDVYKSVGGHNEELVFSEDKDFDLRVRAANYSVCRAKNLIFHNEGNLILSNTLKKKLNYSNTANLFAELHPEAFKWQVNIFNRYYIFLKRFDLFFLHPLLYVGMIYMKTCEFIFGTFGFLLSKDIQKQKSQILNKNKLPFVTYVLPTYNAEKYLSKCLSSIFSQDYPLDKYEVIMADGRSSDSTLEIAKKFNVNIIDNYARVAEVGKLLAYKKSKGEILVLIDSDNVICGKDWLQNMIQPLIYDKSLVGVESNYLIAKDFSSINTYSNLLVIVDPLARILNSRPFVLKANGYSIKTYSKHDTPVAGANGFLWRKSILDKYLIGKNKFAETDLLTEISRKEGVRFANIKGVGIYHYYCETISDYLNKRKKIANKFLNRRQNSETWVDSKNKIYFLLSVLYLATFLGPLIESIYFSIRSKRISWLWHPLISFLTIYYYSFAFLKSKSYSNNI